ncbi:hypothetical protein Bhyg_01486 [Pseudolycoriella hygida]|uniref:Uncharacterized protein n=1 Tax=Pseudolycoriella hygida TaxID=35572 RepID=A0A9Q0N9M5_9DIPT|nr:hypothetical protein Bhyg_01486 [Pseudolycoriella hygida]
MCRFVVLSVLLGIFVSQTIAVYWDGLRVTFGPVPNDIAFAKMPRTANEAGTEGWQPISTTCTNSGQYAGYRYKLRNENSVNLLFDRNGIIAGIQALLPHDEIMNPNNGYRFDLVPMFQNETIDHRLYVVLTAYFVRPDTICTTGRSIQDLIDEGTGNGLWFQNGATPNTLINVPRMRAAASALGWTDCECFPGMGLHNFYEVHRWHETNCDRVRPTQVTFNLDEEMTGFVFQIAGPSTSTRFENPPNAALYAIIGPDRIPQCIIDQNTEFGFSSIHVYFIDQPWTLGCTR